jgi:hypothetical protein
MTCQLTIKVFTSFFIAVFSQSAIACLSPDEEDYVLLKALPVDAKKQPVIAKVQVLTRSDQSAKVSVIEAIKGVKNKQQFTVYTSGSSCGWLDEQSRFSQNRKKTLGQNIYFVAGNWRVKNDPANGFVGSWKVNKRVN